MPHDSMAATYSHSHNNFDLLRLSAAWMVLLGHSFVLYDQSPDPLVAQLGYDALPALAVSIFFIISGYLVTASWLKRCSLRQYAASRFLRIIPALAVVTALTVFVLGPVATVLDLKTYFLSGDSWHYLKNVLIFPLSYTLPGVFEHLPYASAVNGSLWSLKIELRCYIALAIFGMAKLVRPRPMLSVALVCIVAYALLARMADNHPKNIAGIKYTQLLADMHWGFLFAAGAVFYLYREKIRFTRPLFAVAVAADLIGWHLLPHGDIIHLLCLPYIVLYLALGLPPVGRIMRGNDLSYGVYLYAFPLQQLYMQEVGKSLGFTAFVVIATGMVLGAAYLSWRFVESPCLRLKRSTI